MANTKDIRAKIASTIKTQQTTRAMKVVSAAKLRRAQTNIVNARPYARRIFSMIRKVAVTQQVEHPLLAQPSGKGQMGGKMLAVVVTSDRGLCGAFNNNVIKQARTFEEQYKGQFDTVDFLFIGRRGGDFFKKRGIVPVDVITNLANDISYAFAQQTSERLWKAFLAGEYSQIRLVYNEFKSALSQNVIDEVLLPLDTGGAEGDFGAFSKEYIFEPSAPELLDVLIKKHFAVQVYRCLQESVASEHGARMTAMEGATKNAGEMIRNLTLTYNKIRQAAITTELIEITSGAEALKG
jgi:F-type H+-transporting ATPase subunit gamma